jgi:hypothetical protein
MIKLLHPCSILVDNGSECGDGCCWNSWWESENFEMGEEIDDDNPRYDISNLTEGEDYVKIDP